MSASDSPPPSEQKTRSDQWFNTTEWSMVRAAGKDDSAQSGKALETLCQTYWPPIYSYLRATGCSPADAEDYTQEYFSHFLRKNLAGRADPAKGKFRSFILHTLKQFVADQRSKARAQKRGGDKVFVSLDVQAEENYVHRDLAPSLPPEHVFDQRWVQIILDRVASKLMDFYTENGRREMFDHLQSFQPGEQQSCSYEELAKRLKLSVAATKSAIHRLRKRHSELLRQEIAQTVSIPEEIDDEVRYFISCWSQ